MTNISAGNKVEFIFENINLPFDDANNDGYIAFKIKTKPTLVVNDSFSNEASIFFDYNFPIVTNKATSTFKTLGTQDFDFDRYFTVYPNPATSQVTIDAKEIDNLNLEVSDANGRKILEQKLNGSSNTININQLASGIYLFKVNSSQGSAITKVIKK